MCLTTIPNRIMQLPSISLSKRSSMSNKHPQHDNVVQSLSLAVADAMKNVETESTQVQVQAHHPRPKSSHNGHHHPPIIVEHHYHDHASEMTLEYVEEQRPARGGVTTPFPQRLHDMLEQFDRDGHSDIISWQPHGRCFIVRKPQEFKDLLPEYFKLSKMASFQRQLNLYGFQRLTTKRDRGAYYHEYFLRGMKHLSCRITRTKVKGTGVRARANPGQEPNLWDMEWVGPNAEEHTGGTAGASSSSVILTPSTQPHSHHHSDEDDGGSVSSHDNDDEPRTTHQPMTVISSAIRPIRSVSPLMAPKNEVKTESMPLPPMPPQPQLPRSMQLPSSVARSSSSSKFFVPVTPSTPPPKAVLQDFPAAAPASFAGVPPVPYPAASAAPSRHLKQLEEDVVHSFGGKSFHYLDPFQLMDGEEEYVHKNQGQAKKLHRDINDHQMEDFVSHLQLDELCERLDNNLENDDMFIRMLEKVIEV